MYCSACGSAVSPNLTYCNHCGARLSGAKADGITKSSELKPETLVWAITAVLIGGLGAIIGLMALMQQAGGADPFILLMALLSFVLMFVVEGVLIRLLLRSQKGAKEVGDKQRLKRHTTNDLGEAQARVLPEAKPSVTEQTTRALETADRNL